MIMTYLLHQCICMEVVVALEVVVENREALVGMVKDPN
jgi:hypothetical protein